MYTLWIFSCGQLQTVRFGYFKQGTDDLDDTMVVRDVIMEVSNDLKTLDGTMSAKMMLERFLDYDSPNQ